jgi:hypothetical protein
VLRCLKCPGLNIAPVEVPKYERAMSIFNVSQSAIMLSSCFLADRMLPFRFLLLKSLWPFN